MAKMRPAIYSAGSILKPIRLIPLINGWVGCQRAAGFNLALPFAGTPKWPGELDCLDLNWLRDGITGIFI